MSRRQTRSQRWARFASKNDGGRHHGGAGRGHDLDSCHIYPDGFGYKLREALANYERAQPESWRRYDSQSMLGGTLASLRKFAEAEPLMAVAYFELVRRRATIPAENRPVVDQAGQRVVRLYEDWGNAEAAAEWGEKLKLALSSDK